MTRDEIRECVAKWKSALWLGQWTIDIFYKRLDNPDVVAEVTYQPEYFTGKIFIADNRIEQVDERVIIHEMAHFVISPLAHVAGLGNQKDFANYNEELIVSHLTNALYEMAHPNKLPTGNGVDSGTI